PTSPTPAPRAIPAVMLADAAHVQEKDFEYLTRHGRGGPLSEPLYTTPDAGTVQNLIIGLPYCRVLHLRKHLSLEFTDAGHILGSASVDLRLAAPAQHPPVFFRRPRGAGPSRPSTALCAPATSGAPVSRSCGIPNRPKGRSTL